MIWLASSALAAEPLSGDAFDKLTRGKTFYYGDGVTAYGAEQYMPGQRVLWSWLDEECQYGRWFEAESGAICFVYEQEPEPQCWRFQQDGNRLAAHYLNQPDRTTLYELDQSHEPLQCPGPKVGA